MLLVASSDYISRSCNCSVHVITVRDRDLRRRSASRLYCVWGIYEVFVHVGELTFDCLGSDPDQPLTSRRRHHLPRSACSRQKCVWPVLDLRTPCVVVSCAVSVSDAVLLWRTIDCTVEHGRVFVILCIFVYIFVCVNCCVSVLLYSR